MAGNKNFKAGLDPARLIELDACTSCGECLKHCPVQNVTNNSAIAPPEKIKAYREFISRTSGLKALLTGGRIDEAMLKDFANAVFECTTCGACGEVCTVGISTQRLWPALRREMVKRGLGPIGGQALMPDAVRRTGNVYDKPAADRFRPWFPSGVVVKDRADIGYYAGCTGCYEAAPMVRGDVLAIAASGVDFTMLSDADEVCCGFPLFITGQWEILGDLVKRLVDAYAAKGVKTLLCSCPCCVNIMSRDWPALYGRPLPFNIKHITQFVSGAIEQARIKIKQRISERLIYHDPCYLSRGVGVTEEPRRVLRAVCGNGIIEFDMNRRRSRCCGAGGAARKVYHDNAIAMARVTIEEAASKGADRLILSCPACYQKVNEALIGYDKQVRITDIMELLSEVA